MGTLLLEDQLVDQLEDHLEEKLEHDNIEDDWFITHAIKYRTLIFISVSFFCFAVFHLKKKGLEVGCQWMVSVW